MAVLLAGTYFESPYLLTYFSCAPAGLRRRNPTFSKFAAMRTLRLTQSLGDLPVASRVADDTREAWSCPLPNEIFKVGSQGRDEEIAGVGVAMALHRLLVPGNTPVRHATIVRNGRNFTVQIKSF